VVAQDPPAAADYVLRDGLRFVRPYYFDYFAFVKTRWVGATVVDLFTREFTGRPREYYEAALQAGRLRVEDTAMSQGRGRRARLQQQSGGEAGASGGEAAAGPVAPPAAAAAAGGAPVVDVPLQDGQRVRHFVHRHEPPVRARAWRAQGRRYRSRLRTRAARPCTPPHAGSARLCAHPALMLCAAAQVLDTPIAIVATTDTAVAVCKPASMPVHPTARRRGCGVPPLRRCGALCTPAAHAACALALAPCAGAVPQKQRDGHSGQRGMRARRTPHILQVYLRLRR
jgi:hypothetical protein